VRRPLFAVVLFVALAGAAAGAPTQDGAAGEPAADALARAEALYTGSAGRVDEAAARQLFEAAAAAGDPRARLRVATLRYLGGAGLERDRPAARSAARAVTAEIERLAAGGDLEALFLSGSQAIFGLGRPRDAAAGRRIYERAAARGHLWALHNLAWMLETGEGGDRDPARALELYRRAADGGNARSMTDVARLLLAAEPPRGEEAFRWLRKSADLGYRGALEALGDALLFGASAIPANPAEGLVLLERAALADSIDAANDLAYARKMGIGGPADRAAARRWLERTAELGNRWAMVELGWLLIVDQASPADGVEGWRWIDRAAAVGIDSFHEMAGFRSDDPRERTMIDADLVQLERLAATGSPTAQALWARLLSLGFVGGEERHEEAVRWARRAAAAGEPHAMRTLFHAYRHGHGVGQDRVEAVRWLERGAAAGESFCALFLSQSLREGHVVPADPEASLRWLERAAELGNWWAMIDLGNLWAEGWDGRPVDRDRALTWKRRTAALGDEASIGWLRVHAPEEVP
jgi:TPR repeat protein